MRKFALILRNDGSQIPSEKMPDFISALFDWLRNLKTKGVFEGGDIILEDAGVTVTKTNGKIQLGGPFSQGKDLVRGFYYFRAKDQISMLDYCRICPALDFGWQIEVREVDSLD